ncbi:MAG: WD40 repeat domain-containing protein, partial [Candidatus Thorarchaeota archaeon]
FRPTETQIPPLTCMAVDPRGKRIACGTMDSQIFILDSVSGTQKRVLKGHDAAVSAVAFIDGGKGLVSTSWDCTTRRWTSTGPAKDTPILRHNSEVKALTVGTEKTRGAAGSRDGEVKVFYTSSMKNYRNIQAHRTDVSGLVFAREESVLVTASWDGECKIFDLSSFEFLATLTTQKERIRSIAVTHDSSKVFLGLHNGIILSIDPDNPKDVFEMTGHSDIVTSLAIDPSSTYLASGSWDRSVKVWSVKKRKMKNQDRLLTGISSIGWNPNGSGFYTTDYSGALRFWDYET